MLVDYILERCEQLQKEAEAREKRRAFLPWKSIKDSPFQVGEYFIEVCRIYRNDGTGTSYLNPILKRCIQNTDINGEEYRWGKSAAYSRVFQQAIWNYLHYTYGQQIVVGYYPCDSSELIQQATWLK